MNVLRRELEWLTAAISGNRGASPVGLYFARLWYFEELYPLIFALGGVAAVNGVGGGNGSPRRNGATEV